MKDKDMATFKIVTFKKSGNTWKEVNPISLDLYSKKNLQSLQHMVDEINKNKNMYPNEVIIYEIPNTNPQLFESHSSQGQHYFCD